MGERTPEEGKGAKTTPALLAQAFFGLTICNVILYLSFEEDPGYPCLRRRPPLSGIASKRIVESPDEAVFHRIAEHDVALAIWHRPQAEELAGWLDSLPAERLPELVLVDPRSGRA